MRHRFLVLAPLLLAGAGVIACGQATQRSSFKQEAPSTEPVAGFGNEFENSNDAGGEGDGSCSSSQTTITRTPIVIEFVVDASGSMDTGKRWVPARDALLAAFEDLNASADPAMFVGLQRYGTNLGNKVVPNTFANPDHHDKMIEVIDTAKAGEGGTGTEAALRAGYGYVERFKPPTSSGLAVDEMKRVIILVSDGKPDGEAAGQQACEDVVESKFAGLPPKGPVLTFSIGIGALEGDTSYDPAFMGRLALKGGTAPAGCDPASTDPALLCHFQVTPGEDPTTTKEGLLNAINTIRALTASCEFGFEATKDTDLSKIQVVITAKDGTTTAVKTGPMNGWTFDDPTNPKKVILNGASCAATNGTVSGRVDVVLGCRGAK